MFFFLNGFLNLEFFNGARPIGIVKKIEMHWKGTRKLNKKKLSKKVIKTVLDTNYLQSNLKVSTKLTENSL